MQGFVAPGRTAHPSMSIVPGGRVLRSATAAAERGAALWKGQSTSTKILPCPFAYVSKGRPSGSPLSSPPWPMPRRVLVQQQVMRETARWRAKVATRRGSAALARASVPGSHPWPPRPDAVVCHRGAVCVGNRLERHASAACPAETGSLGEQHRISSNPRSHVPRSAERSTIPMRR